MKTVFIQGRPFYVSDILAIEDVEKDKKMFLNREAGFRIILLNKVPSVFGEKIPYETYPKDILRIKDKWAELQEKAVQAWSEAVISMNQEKIPDIAILETERFQWALKTFPEATAISSLRKLESEIKEIESDISSGNPNPEEYADALMCLFDSAGRCGVTVKDIFKAFESKLEINKNRVWVKNPDNSYSHVKP